MSTYSISKSRYTATSLNRSDTDIVRSVADHAVKATEVTKVANHEIAQVGAHAIGTMATLVSGANGVQRQLVDSGIRNPVYDDAQAKVLEVTGHNLITMANAAQKEIIQSAAKAMR
jgi:hypothetical protein